MGGRAWTLGPLCGVLALGTGVVAGCGADDRAVDAGAASGAAVAGPAIGRAGFPDVAGGALSDVTDGVPLVLRATQRTDATAADGRHRDVAFTLRDRAGTPLQGARAAVYVARPDGTGARGPYTARTRPVAALPPGADQGARLAAATSEYVVRVPARRARRMLLSALVEVDGRLIAAAPYVSPAS
jgi:hypothetical protein